MVKAYIFDAERNALVPNPAYVVPEQNSVEAEEVLTTSFDDLPGGAFLEGLQPPEAFTVNQIVKNNVDGTTSVDLIIEVPGSGNYEVRYARL